MIDIFISYAREDLAHAQALAELFDGHGWSTFWDRTIPAGRNFEEFLEQKIEEARCVLVLWSEASVTSRWVREEAREGLDRDVLVPVLLAQIRPPFGFRGVHAVDLSAWDPGRPLEVPDTLVADLEGRLGVPTRQSDRSGGTEFETPWRPGETFQEDPRYPEMVVVPAGSFLMGSPDDEPGRDDGEGPQHQVTLQSFAIGKYPVSFDEFDSFCDASGAERPGDEGWGRGQRPAINLSWQDAQAYVTWLAGVAEKPYRLPSEAEWEYACRAGTSTRYAFGVELSAEQANVAGSLGKTTEVGAYPANPYGLHDMHGNVWEWVEDHWHDTYDGAPGDGRPWLDAAADDDASRVVRGGSWGSLQDRARCAVRSGNRPRKRLVDVGFRVLCSSPISKR